MSAPFDARRLAAVVAMLLACLAWLGPAPASARSTRAVLAFLPGGGSGGADPVLDRLDAHPQLALGLVSATQGSYSPTQMLLDVTAGSRTSASVYDPQTRPRLGLAASGGGAGVITGWAGALSRARKALAEIDPGLLASQIPGGAGYAGVAGRGNLEAVAAADRHGRVDNVSLGSAGDLAVRVKALLRHHRLVVAGLPAGVAGDRALAALLRDHHPGDLLLVIQAPPNATVPQLLPAGAVLPDGSNGLLSSQTTRLHGIVAATDVPVTILHDLHLHVPSGVKGQPIDAEGRRDAGALKRTDARLRVINSRRTPAIYALLATWALLTLVLGAVARRRGVRAGMRIGGLAMLWVLSVLLLTAWLAPARDAEIAIIAGGSFGLAALTDRLVRWPRGPLLPSAVALAAYATDLAFGSPLIIRSLLGVNPRSGSRFYGLGNELESTLVILLLVGLAALLMRRADFDSRAAAFGAGPGRSRRAALIVAGAGVVAAVFVGAGQLGADVGGVITFGSGIAVMTVLMAPGRASRRTIVLALLAPVGAVAGLAALDLATGGNGHFTRTILHADSARSLWDVVERRYTLAYDVLRAKAMPFITALTLVAIAYGVRRRERLYAPLRGSPAWRAALAGGLTASIVGALANDSGPILLVFGVFVLACVTAYVACGPPRAGDH